MKEEPLKDYEKEHTQKLRNSSAECTLFLKTNGAFPVEKPCKVLLAGCGARQTLKGGLGSGDVESRCFTTCEQGLENSGFEVVSKKWLDDFPKFKQDKHKEFVELIKSLAEKYKSTPGNISFGYAQPEAEYDLPLDYEADIAIYVLSRLSGEGTDRHLCKGDALLTDSEIRDILLLNKKFSKFMLVLNVVGVVDLSPVNEVSNILLLSQLGVVTGDILADVVLGKANPSGKLSTTWAAIKDYKFINEFGDVNDTKYLEGVYVGYRYFDSANVKPLYPFGFGKSYTDFNLSKVKFSNNKDEITVKAKVKNVGKYSGKEVVQVYVSPSQNNKDKPYQSLVAFKKSKELKPQEEEELTLSFNLEDVARYDEEKASFVLDNGNYIVRVGNSSDNTSVFGYVNLSEDVVTEKLLNKGGKADFKDFAPEVKLNDDLTNVESVKLTKNDFVTKVADYNYYKPEINEKLSKLTDEDLANLCCGNYKKKGEKFFQHVVGAAGETTSYVKEIDKYLVMSDGPAGLRITRIYGEDDKGYFRLCYDPMNDRMRYYMTPEQWKKEDMEENNKDRKGKITYQYTTAIPIGTALAQSFNVDLVKMCGDIVGKEMEIFKIHIWLAPGLNIHRNILCGRNFEYYSEDPLVSGKMAAAATLGVQSHKNKGTTIKHFCCNNQDFDRKNSNSIVSERALREIYLKGFRIAIKESNPVALMTSYNIVNGLHSSERKDLVTDVLRNEWKYEGLIMSDWYNSEENEIGVSKNRPQSSTNNAKAGNNIQMSCSDITNYLDLVDSLKNKRLTREDLLVNASVVYKTMEKLNQ